jgi:hypothetical protein
MLSIGSDLLCKGNPVDGARISDVSEKIFAKPKKVGISTR